MSAPEFTVEVFQNEYLSAGAREVNAVVTVTATGSEVSRSAATGCAAEIIVVDSSGSMGAPVWKLIQARQATAAAIDALRDGVAFAIVAGSHVARALYPLDARLTTANARTRADAKRALRHLRAGGGTAIGEWLRLARDIFATCEAPLRHVILLTDGQNQESRAHLATAIRLCEGEFSCDCRGVGTDWKVDELREISTALLGTVDIVADPDELAADFEAMMQASMDKEVADVALRVWTPAHATVRFVKQVAPAIEDLTGRRAQSSPQAGDYPTGAWGTESRDYHVCVGVEPALVGQEMLAARISLILDTADGPKPLGQGLVRAIWTDDEGLSTRIIHRPDRARTGHPGRP